MKRLVLFLLAALLLLAGCAAQQPTATVREGIAGAVLMENGKVAEYHSGQVMVIETCTLDFVYARWDGNAAWLTVDTFEPGVCDGQEVE